MEGYVATAARPGCIGVMVFIDSDGDCVADLGTSLAARARATVGVPVHIVAAESTFEDWLYASAESLMLDLAYEPGTRGLGAIQRALAPVKYIKPVWQPRLTARLDIAMATERNASLRRALARFDELVDHHFGLS